MVFAGDELFFQTINQSWKSIDVGSVKRVGTQPEPGRSTQPVVPQAKPSPSQPGPRQSK
jgi:hypothetical protein